MALAKRNTAATADFVPFLSRDFYASSGAGITPGQYALEFEIQEFQATDKTTGVSKGEKRLGVMITAYPLNDSDPETSKKSQFLSMGSKAIHSFSPDPSGKRLVAKPGGQGGALQTDTNWDVFWKSLLNADPEAEGAASKNDLSVFDGVWVAIAAVPEPETRKGFRGSQAATGEAALTQNAFSNTPQMIPAVAEILEGGKPWEGGGGMPTGETKTAPAAKAAPAKAASGLKKAPPAASNGNGDVHALAVEAMGAVLSNLPPANPKISKLKLRNDVFKAAGQGDEASAIIEEFFASDDALNGILGEHGYVMSGSNAVPA